MLNRAHFFAIFCKGDAHWRSIEHCHWKAQATKIGRRPSISTVIKSLPDTHKNRFTVEPLTDQCRIYIKNNKKLFVQVGYKRQ